MEDLKGSKKFALELFIPLCFDILAIQLDLLARTIATALYSLVMGSLLQLLCME